VTIGCSVGTLVTSSVIKRNEREWFPINDFFGFSFWARFRAIEFCVILRSQHGLEPKQAEATNRARQIGHYSLRANCNANSHQSAFCRNCHPFTMMTLSENLIIMNIRRIFQNDDFDSEYYNHSYSYQYQAYSPNRQIAMMCFKFHCCAFGKTCVLGNDRRGLPNSQQQERKRLSFI